AMARLQGSSVHVLLSCSPSVSAIPAPEVETRFPPRSGDAPGRARVFDSLLQRHCAALFPGFGKGGGTKIGAHRSDRPVKLRLPIDHAPIVRMEAQAFQSAEQTRGGKGRFLRLPDQRHRLDALNTLRLSVRH